MSASPELHLFVLWGKARRAEKRILADIRLHLEIVAVRELAFDRSAEMWYCAFYGPALPDVKRKIHQCGRGRFLVVVVRDVHPCYAEESILGSTKPRNVLMVELKDKYRKWAHGSHRVHGTVDATEFNRDVRMLTGYDGNSWRCGTFQDDWKFDLPAGWGATRTDDPRERIEAQPVYLNPVSLPKDAHVDWDDVLSGVGAGLGLSDARLFLSDKYINDCFYSGRFRCRACVVKCSTRAVRLIRAEFMRARAVYAEDAAVVAEPLGFFMSADGRYAFALTTQVEGPSLAELLRRGISDCEATRFADDLLRLARALQRADIVHRDLFADNLLLGADGHLKAIDWQLAVRRNPFIEDVWIRRHWKFRYVVFGVNRELGLGRWNDFHALGKILAQFPQTTRVRDVRHELAVGMPTAGASDPPDVMMRVKLALYAVSLRLQMLLRGRHHRKYAQLERRYRTICGTWRDKTDVEKGAMR